MWDFLKKKKHEEFEPPAIWVDVHSHILFGLDDGAKTIEESIKMALKAEKIGITDIIATPHCSNQFNPSAETVKKNYLQLRDSLKKQGSKINLLLGREINFLMIQIENLKTNENLLIKDSKNHALIELPEGLNKTSIIEGFFELMIAGIRPIVAHPERNSLVEREPEFIQELRTRDFLIQVDAGSITGAYGNKTKQIAWTLLQEKLVDIVSSDAHCEEHFEHLEEACKQLASKFGNEYVKKVISKNPKQILQI